VANHIDNLLIIYIERGCTPPVAPVKHIVRIFLSRILTATFEESAIKIKRKTKCLCTLSSQTTTHTDDATTQTYPTSSGIEQKLEQIVWS
jgi:hypothetical protein